MVLLRENHEVYQSELLDLKNDFVFKAFFGDRRNQKLLIQFLNAILDVSIASVELLNPTIEIMHLNDKSSVMDLRCVTNIGEQINIEMQLREHQAFPERMLMYWAKMYASQDEVAKSYRDLKKAIQIIITDFNFLPKPHFHSMFQLRDREDGFIFSKNVEIHVLELSKLDCEIFNETNELEKWVLFLKGDKKMKEALAMESPTMKDAYEEIERLSQDPKTRDIAWSREKFLKDQEQREYEAVALREREIVLNMLAKRVPKETIAELLNISIEKIEDIINSK